MNCKSIFYLLALTVVTFSSCEKEAGIKGEPGEQGSPGVNGSAILSGTGAPASTLGKDGDYYIDNSTSVFYGPKTGSSWNTSVNLRGEDGSNGQNGQNGSNGAQGPSGSTGPAGSNGSTILNGTAAPALSVGNIGDYYINTATADFYGPKTISSWGTSISLKGPKGDDSGTSSLKMEIYKSRQFYNISLTSITANDVYTWTGKSYPASSINYADYNENGLVLIYLRDIKNPEAGWNSVIDEQGYVVRSNNKKNFIEIISEFDGKKPEDIALIKNYRFDVKVVYIPISIVSKLSLNHIDTKNVKLVESFLKLNN